MEQNKIKIYIADELDTINRVCEKFNISKQVLFIFNPLLKNKSKLTNIPIKIPYTKEENDKKESQTVRQKEEISVKYILLMRSALIYKYYDKHNVLKNTISVYSCAPRIHIIFFTNFPSTSLNGIFSRIESAAAIPAASPMARQVR